jgi:retron-type reverse transcriptase
MRVERRGRVIWVCLVVNRCSRDGPKSFDISKQVVFEAYRRVKANKGAAGVDGESIEQFEADLKGNLYKLWNRMSSGTYFPPPVRMVEIDKPGGVGVRVLGVPTDSAYGEVA